MENSFLQRHPRIRFRANPQYELVLYDRLSSKDKSALHDLTKDKDFYGILRPRQKGGLGVKAVCSNTALLFLTLQTPAEMPLYVQKIYGNEIGLMINQFVLDDILQIENNGIFVSGTEALSLLGKNTSDVIGDGEIAQLSLAAIRYGQALCIEESVRLSARMYFFNRQPLTPMLQRKCPTASHIAELLEIGKDSRIEAQLNKGWTKVSIEQGNDLWLLWKNRISGQASLDSALIYKLYVSPTFEAIHEVFPAIADLISELQPLRFKVGGNLASLLRPDKFVLYFETLERLNQAADILAKKLSGTTVQGVPFTAELAGDGLLSWGIDPPRNQLSLDWQERETWRLWITNRLATALISAKFTQERAIEPWQFALKKLRLEGVDPKTWTPNKNLWS